MVDPNKLILSKKYKGVYTKKQTDGSIAIYIAYTNSNNQYNRYKIGIKGINGLNESVASLIRAQEIQKIKLGEDTILSLTKTIVLFDEIGEDYLKKQNQDKIKMFEVNKRRYYKHIYPYFKNKNIKKITSEDVRDFKHLKLQTYKPATVYWMVGFIGSIYFHAINRTGKFKGLNPAYGIFNKKEFNNKRKRYLTHDEVNLLLIEIEKLTCSFQFYIEMFIRISLSTGARVNAVLSLVRSDINIDSREIRLYDAKNKEYYQGYLSPVMVPNNKLLKLLEGLKPNDYVFFYNGTKFYTKKIQRVTYPIFKKLFNKDISDDDEINKVCLHTLRHTFASLAVQKADIFLVQKLLNHKDIKQTLRYAKVDEDLKREAVDKLF